jgi:hypothetical protein
MIFWEKLSGKNAISEIILSVTGLIKVGDPEKNRKNIT